MIKKEIVCHECLQEDPCGCVDREPLKRLLVDIYFRDLDEEIRDRISMALWDDNGKYISDLIVENNWDKIPFFTLVLAEYKDDLDINPGVDKAPSV